MPQPDPSQIKLFVTSLTQPDPKFELDKKSTKCPLMNFGSAPVWFGLSAWCRNVN